MKQLCIFKHPLLHLGLLPPSCKSSYPSALHNLPLSLFNTPALNSSWRCLPCYKHIGYASMQSSCSRLAYGRRTPVHELLISLLHWCCQALLPLVVHHTVPCLWSPRSHTTHLAPWSTQQLTLLTDSITYFCVVLEVSFSLTAKVIMHTCWNQEKLYVSWLRG